MTFYEKFKLWFVGAGLRSFAYLGFAAGVYIFLGWSHVAMFLLGIFFTDNWVAIKQLWKDYVDPYLNKEDEQAPTTV